MHTHTHTYTRTRTHTRTHTNTHNTHTHVHTHSRMYTLRCMQRVPHFLLALDDPVEEMEASAAASGFKGCAICGGLGHRATQCPKLQVCVCTCVCVYVCVCACVLVYLLVYIRGGG